MILSIFKFSVMSENILATVIYLIISFLVTGYGLFLKRRVVNSEKRATVEHFRFKRLQFGKLHYNQSTFLFYSLGFYAKMISDALQKTISEGQVCKINIKRV